MTANGQPSAEMVVEALGPVTARHVIVVHGVEESASHEFLRTLSDAFIAAAKAQGADGDARAHLPLIVSLSAGQSLAVLDEDDMAREGWYRR